jgi:hypothetical protein
MSTLEQWAYMMAKPGPEALIYNGARFLGLRNGLLRRLEAFTVPYQFMHAGISPDGRFLYVFVNGYVTSSFQDPAWNFQKYILSGTKATLTATTADGPGSARIWGSPGEVVRIQPAISADSSVYACATTDASAVKIYAITPSGPDTLLQTISLTGGNGAPIVAMAWNSDASVLFVLANRGNTSSRNNLWIIKEASGTYSVSQSVYVAMEEFQGGPGMALAPSGAYLYINYSSTGATNNLIYAYPLTDYSITPATFTITDLGVKVGESQMSISPDGQLLTARNQLYSVSGSSLTYIQDLGVNHYVATANFFADSQLATIQGTVWRRHLDNTFTLLPNTLGVPISDFSMFNFSASYSL